MISPRTLQGFFDYLPDQMALRQYVKDTWRGIFEKYGYGQLETPSLEYADILFGKYGEEEKLIYHFKDHGDRHVALRYDQTVPLARVTAQYLNHGITLPFKRYEINRVWRADAARKGRKREFYQCDADILGSNSLLCEAEIISLLFDGFSNLQLKDHVNVISHRLLLKAYLKKLGISAHEMIEVYRSVDKLDKVGANGVEDELRSRKIAPQAIAKILDFIENRDETVDQTLKRLSHEIGKEEDGKKAIQDLEELFGYLKAMNIPQKNYMLKPSLVRGLDYYTGVIFEIIVPEFGNTALAGGGRYDDLCSTFTKEQIPGIGVGIGFESICMLLEEQKLYARKFNAVDILIIMFDQTLISDYVIFAKKLREKNLKTEIYINGLDKISKQFKYADKNNIPYTLVLGPDEKKENSIILKNMKSGKQEKLKKEDFLRSPEEYLKD